MCIRDRFVTNEPFVINGTDNNRIATAITSFSMKDVKQLYGGPELGDVGSAKTFTGDVIQRPVIDFGNAQFSAKTPQTGLCTVTSENALFPGSLKVGNILSFGGLGNNVPSFARITSVSTNEVSVTGVATVTGVCSGEIPTSSTNDSS